MTFVGTTAIYFATLNWLKVIPYFALGQFSIKGLGTSLVLLPLAVATNMLGFWVVRVTPQALFYRITLILMFLISLELVRSGMTDILRGGQARAAWLTWVGRKHPMAKTPYDTDLDRNPANFQPLTPLGFLERAAGVFPGHTAVIHGAAAAALTRSSMRAPPAGVGVSKRGIKRGDTVSAMLAKIAGHAGGHYGVPMTKAVLNTLNTRLDAPIIAFSLDHAEAKVGDRRPRISKVDEEALALCKAKPW